MSPSGAVRVDPVGIAHNAVLVRLHAACFDDAWSSQAMAEVLAASGTFASLASVQDGGGELPVGFALARLAADEAELLTLCVLPPWRRHGFAARLLGDVMRRADAAGAKRMFLEVAENNEPAGALYAAHGFTAVGRRPDYYRLANRVPVAALTLRRDLGQ